MRNSSSREAKSTLEAWSAIWRRSMAAIFSSARIRFPRASKSLFCARFGGERRAFRKIRMGHRDRAAHVADLVRNRAHQDARSGQKLVQAQLFAVSQIFGAIDHHRRQPGARAGAVSGKPDVGQKNFAVLPAPPALHGSAKWRPLVVSNLDAIRDDCSIHQRRRNSWIERPGSVPAG